MNADEILSQLGRQAQAAPAWDVLPSGSPSLDILLGGGWPAGVISELCGPQEFAVPFAYRTVNAVQTAYPDEPVLMCCGHYSRTLAARYHVDEDRLLVTGAEDTALRSYRGARLAVLDRPFGYRDALLREDRSMAVLCLTMYPGSVRSAACVQLSSLRGSRIWAMAERRWIDRWALLDCKIPVCTGRDAAAQEILELALRLGIATRRARYLYYGEDSLGGSWQEADERLSADTGLRMQVLADIAERAPLHPDWRHVYARD